MHSLTAVDERISAFYDDDEEEDVVSTTQHHLVPARLVRVAHQLKQLDEADHTKTIATLSRMQLPQMTSQIRDVEQRALEMQREEGREEFRVKALSYNLVNRTIPEKIVTAKSDGPRDGTGTAWPPPPSSLGWNALNGVPDDAGDADAMATAEGYNNGEQSSAAMASGGMYTGAVYTSPAKAAMSTMGACPPGSGGACMHATCAESYAGLSHTSTAAAARATHSLSDSLSRGTSSAIASTLADGNPTGGAESGPSHFTIRVVSPASLALRATCGVSSTTITTRSGLLDTSPAPHPLDTRPGAADHALWVAEGEMLE